MNNFVQRAPRVLFVVLLIVLAAVIIWSVKKTPQTETKNVSSNLYPAVAVDSVPTPTPAPVSGTSGFPVPLGSPGVGSVMVHYYFSGTIKSIKTLSGNFEITLDINNPALPPLIIMPDSRVSKISPPYGQNTSVPYPPTQMKPGQHVDVSAEYDTALHKWFVRDVFLPTDKNTNL